MGTESKKRVDLCMYRNDSEIIFLDTHTHTYIYTLKLSYKRNTK